MKLRYFTDDEIEILKSNIFIKDIIYKRAIEYEVVFNRLNEIMSEYF